MPSRILAPSSLSYHYTLLLIKGERINSFRAIAIDWCLFPPFPVFFLFGLKNRTQEARHIITP